MISFTSRQKYYFYSGPMDMRKDIDTLSEVVRSQMGLDPYIEESVFIFYVEESSYNEDSLSWSPPL